MNLIAVYVAWGSTYLAIRFAIETMPPFFIAGFRFLFSGAVLWRRRAVAYEAPGLPLGNPAADAAAPGGSEFQGKAPDLPRAWTWAALMRRAFALAVLACPRWGGRMRVSAPSEDPRVMRRLLAPLGLPTAVPPPRPPPARSPARFADGPA